MDFLFVLVQYSIILLCLQVHNKVMSHLKRIERYSVSFGRPGLSSAAKAFFSNTHWYPQCRENRNTEE